MMTFSSIFDEILMLDFETLKYLDSTLLKIDDKTCFEELTIHVGNSYRKLNQIIQQGSKKKNVKVDFSKQVSIIESKINLSCDNNKNIIIYLGGAVLTSNELSYYLIFAEQSDRNIIIRKKIHFDTILPNGKHPKFHMQLPGTLTSYLKEECCEATFKSLYPKIEQPRIPSLPMTLGILFNQIFNEFQTDVGLRVVRNCYWKKHLRDCEAFVYKNYYKPINDMFNDKKNTKLLFKNWYYE